MGWGGSGCWIGASGVGLRVKVGGFVDLGLGRLQIRV